MTIRSPSGSYDILALLRGDKRRLIARRNNETTCLLLMVDSPPLARTLIPYFSAFSKMGTFTDFIEIFPHGQGFYAVFRYQDALHMRSLRDVLNNAPPPERATALRSLFAWLLTQEPPYPILCDLLRPENTLCSPSGQIVFLYDLCLIADYTRNDRAKAMACLSGTVRTICGDVFGPQSQRLCSMLTGEPQNDWVSLYQAASEAADELEAHTPEEQPTKPGLRERAAVFRDTLTHHAAALVALFLFVLEYVLLMVLFYHFVIAPAPADNGIPSIGSVIVQHDEEKPAPEDSGIYPSG